MSPNTYKRIGLTTGDVDGIGLEVALKALLKIGVTSKIQFVLFRSGHIKNPLLKKISRKFKVREYMNWPEALQQRLWSSKELIDIASPLPPAKWVEVCAQACVSGSMAAMVTGPLSKPGIISAGLNDLGHTGILSRVTGSPNPFMGFVGKHFNVVLATGHIPIEKIATSLNQDILFSAIKAADIMRKSLPKKRARLPIGVLGLNPHAGDDGLIGKDEKSLFFQLESRCRAAGLEIRGPLVPDTAFQKKNWDLFSVFVACYHDQGLIPFKLAHGFGSGVHWTLNLPIIRTSVDHGTAKDLFGKGRADFGSMVDAIELAIKLVSQ